MSKLTLRLLFAFTFVSSILAEVTWTQFSNSFLLYPSTGPGGCDRNAPNGVAMKDVVLTSLDDAWAASDKVVRDLSNYQKDRDVRALLFLLFGITWTEDYEPNPGDSSDEDFDYILEIFYRVDKLKTSPDPDGIYSYGYNFGRFRCLEDYATYYRHMPGDDRKGNMTAPLIAEVFNVTTANGSYFPGLMYVNNAAITQNEDQSEGFYFTDKESPQDGQCGDYVDGALSAFTNMGAAKATFGITLCHSTFLLPTTSSLGSPRVDAGTDEIDTFRLTVGMIILHEMIHFVSRECKKPYPALCKRYSRTNRSHIDIYDQPAVYPPSGSRWDDRDFAKWTEDLIEEAYGYIRCAFLGLVSVVQRRLALQNADSYTVLTVCIRNPELDCLGTFQDYIIAKRKLPFQVSPRTVRKIRSGELDLKKDDVPTDVPDDFLSMYQSEIEGAGIAVFDRTEQPSRFENVEDIS